LRGDFFDAEAHRVDVDPGGFEPHDDLVHEQRQLLSPARGRDVHRQFSPALGARLGARGDPLTDDLAPLFAIDRGPGVARRRLSRTREQRAEGGGFVTLRRGAQGKSLAFSFRGR